MSYTTIVFDLDGTLLNTLDDLKDSVNYALSKLGYPIKTLDEVRKSVGNGAKLLIDRVVPEGTSPENSAKCLQIYQQHYTTNMQNKTCPYDGIVELLKTLKEMGVKLAIVSNKYDAYVKSLCKEFYGDYIQVAIGESPEVAKKPAPDSVYTALNVLDASKAEAIYVGDSDVDVQTAHNAGLPCVGVTWGFRDRDILKEEGADFIIDKPCELISLFQ